MTDRQIRIFLTVADNLNFSAAAKTLYMSQQAVTRQIAALESEVGVRLFTRTTRSVSLTPAGEVFRREFQAIDQQARLCMTKIRSLGMRSTNVISLGIFEHFSRTQIIFPLMTELMRAYPEVYFDIHLLDFSELRTHLADQLLDLCVTTASDWAYWPNTAATVCLQKPFEIVYSKSMGLEGDFSLEKLGKFPQLTLPMDVLVTGRDEWSKRIPFLHDQPCPDLPSLVIRMEAGQGFAMLTRVFEGADSPNLVFQPLPFPEARADIVCITNQGHTDPHLEEIISRIRRFFVASAL